MVHHSHTKYLATRGWIAMKFMTDIHGDQITDPTKKKSKSSSHSSR